MKGRNFMNPTILQDAKNPMFPCGGGQACIDMDTHLPLPCWVCFGIPGAGSHHAPLMRTPIYSSGLRNHFNASGSSGCGCGCGSCDNNSYTMQNYHPVLGNHQLQNFPLTNNQGGLVHFGNVKPRYLNFNSF